MWLAIFLVWGALSCAPRRFGEVGGARIADVGELGMSMFDGARRVAPRCTEAMGADGKRRVFAAGEPVPLGRTPRVTELSDAGVPGVKHANPVPEDAEIFVRAASAVQVLHGKVTGTGSGAETVELAVAQDTRRQLAFVSFPLSWADVRRGAAWPAPKLEFLPLATAAERAKWENDADDYVSVRKKAKRDFEAMATLPDGTLLVMGSGSDLSRLAEGKAAFRASAATIDPKTRKVETFDLQPFLVAMQNEKDVVGASTSAGAPMLNIEDVAVRQGPPGLLIAFLHRGNLNGNGHNSIVEWEFEGWMRMLRGGPAPKARRIIHLNLGTVKAVADPGRGAVPLTTTDALMGRLGGSGAALLPVTAEAEFHDASGRHVDGAVVYSGIARWTDIDADDGGKCVLFQAPGEGSPGELTRFGKLEGLAASVREAPAEGWARGHFEPGAIVIGVSDADSEILPSQLRRIDLEGILQ